MTTTYHRHLAVALLFFLQIAASAQDVDQWHLLDPQVDGIEGVSVDKGHALLGNKKLEPVIVAVIDDGVDISHPAFRGKIYVNKAEIAGNGKDDDGNNYVDDREGWNYLGNPLGEHISAANMEVTRLYRAYKQTYETVNPEELDKKAKVEYQKYANYKALYEAQLEEANGQFEEWAQIAALYQGAYSYMAEKLGEETITLDALMAFETKDEGDMELRNFLMMAEAEGLRQELGEAGEELQEAFKYHLNLDFDPRQIVNEAQAQQLGIAYGNPIVNAANPKHGTHVAGIIAADRRPESSIRGIAKNAILLPLRAVPNGDERDEDVALAIRYAVDQGARVINMSFGKSLSPNRELVDEAIQYAASKDVLLIHAAGNDGENIDRVPNFPNGSLGKKHALPNWITVGAAGQIADSLYLADFSNYGRKQVDIVAPGIDIWSLAPDSAFVKYSGTSMAAPVVSGIAVVLRGAYPTLSASEIKKIICLSVSDLGNLKVIYADGFEPLKKIVRCPGTPSLYRALEIAEQRHGKK